jgi:hypothetical protein
MRRLVGLLGSRVTLGVDDSPLKINTLCSMTRSKLWPVSGPRHPGREVQLGKRRSGRSPDRARGPEQTEARLARSETVQGREVPQESF